MLSKDIKRQHPRDKSQRSETVRPWAEANLPKVLVLGKMAILCKDQTSTLLQLQFKDVTLLSLFFLGLGGGVGVGEGGGVTKWLVLGPEWLSGAWTHDGLGL